MYIRGVPKLIDAELRSVEITEAAWRVLVREGSSAVTVRNVAVEAGLATGSLRRAFPTQADLLAACLTLVGDRVEARIRALPESTDPVERAVAVLAETLPLDDERRREMHVYLTLGTAALSEPTLRSAYRASSNDLAGVCALIIDSLLPDHPAQRRQQEAAHLYAVVDGLALHTLHGDDPTQALALLRAHLSRLTDS